MKPQLEKELLIKYPKLFRQHGLSPQETCMCWGVECGDGWFTLLNTLCHLIRHHVDWKQKKDPEFNVEFSQIKEKFGTLRVYANGIDSYVEGLIAMAEAMSSNICERCGNPGKVRNRGWIQTLCDGCEEANRKEVPSNDD